MMENDKLPAGLMEMLEKQAHADAPPALIARLEKQIQGDLKPVRPLPGAGYFLAAMALIFAGAIAIVTYGSSALGIEAQTWMQLAVVLPVLAAGATLLAISMVKQMVPGSRHWISPFILPVVTILVLLSAIAIVFRIHVERDLWGGGVACLKMGASYAAPSGFLFWLLLRRGAMLTPRLSGATAGMLAGIVGTFVLEIHCPNTNMMHIALFHCSHAVFGAAAGFAIGTLAEALHWR